MTTPHLVVGTQTTLAGRHVADDALLPSLVRTYESTLAKIERYVNVGSSHDGTGSVAQTRSDIDLLLSRHGWWLDEGGMRFRKFLPSAHWEAGDVAATHLRKTGGVQRLVWVCNVVFQCPFRRIAFWAEEPDHGRHMKKTLTLLI